MSYRLGLDIGIASCGFSVLKTNGYGIPYKIIRLNSVVFSKGETPRGESIAANRRTYRSSRRLNRRRKFRKYRVRRLFINNNLLTKHDITNIYSQKPMPSVYQLRVKGLKHALTNSELFQVLYYLTGHRGFKSNRKYALNSKNAGPLLKSIHNSKSLLKSHGYKTIGEMITKDDKFNHQKRNHDYNNGYLVTASRSMIDDEAKQILEIQKKFNHQISSRFVNRYLSILDSQRNYDEGPAKPSPYAGNQIEKMIGKDTLDHTQERAAKATYTFEYYQLISNLNNLQYKEPFKHWIRLTKSQKDIIIKLCFKRKKVTFKQIKSALKLNDDVKFNLVRYGDYKNSKIAERRTTFDSLTAIHEINSKLPDNLKNKPNLIDNIGEILTKFASDDARRKAFKNRLQLPQPIVEQLLLLNFSKFSKLSLKTMRKLIPYLRDGFTLNGAIAKLGYHNVNKIDAKYVHENVKNPVVMRAFTIVRKVVRAVINRYGKPDAINIELARDLAKSYKERQQIQKAQHKLQQHNERAAARLRSNGFPVNGQNITIDNLFHEQHGIDPYTGKHMEITQIFNGNGNKYNIDHIVPYSWTFDDSYTNKILVSAKANEDKANRLPMQYLMNNQKRKNFLIYFAHNYIKNYKKRMNLLRAFITKKQLNEWKTRNINDTRYLNKLIANYLRQNIKFSDNPNLGKERVISLNGSMTAKMRHRWGLVKVRANGDKHHAIDATVIASVTPALIKRVNDFNKYQEIKDNPILWHKNDFKALKHHVLTNKLFKKIFNAFPLPWPDFRDEIVGRLSTCPAKYMSGNDWDHYTSVEINNLKPVHVVHVANRTINGQVNGDTLRSAKYLNTGLIMSRANVANVHLTKKGQIKSGFYSYRPQKDNTDIVMRTQLIKQLKAHGGKGTKAFPNGYMTYKDNHGYQHIVRKIKLFKNSKSGVISNYGRTIMDRKKIVRIDVFQHPNGKYCYVPIYLNDVLRPQLPTVIANEGNKVKVLSDEDKFKFSLYSWAPVHIVFKKPRKIKWLADDHDQFNVVKNFYGYYFKSNVNLGAMDFMSFDRSFNIHNVGVGTIQEFNKFNINYLGDLHKVNQSTRLSFKDVK